MTAIAMMHESIWFDQPKYEEAECHYQLHLAKLNGPVITNKVASHSASALIDEITKARNSIKKSLNEAPSCVQGSEKSVASLEKENTQLRKLITDLTKRMGALELRMSKMEGGKEEEPSAKPKEDDDDDFDIFGDDDDDEEETEETKLLVAKYHEKKSKKPQVVAKSNILLDIKPWADDTDMAEMEKLVRGVATDGLKWGSSKLVPVAYGIKKLQISCVVEDEKVGTDFLEEAIIEFEEHVQSVDVAAFNKV